MSLFVLKSTNPMFSHIVSKNPTPIWETKKPFVRALRKGNLYGWFPEGNDKEWRMLFVDHPSETSFSEGVLAEYEYLDQTRYNHPYLPIAMITTALASSSKSRHEADTDEFEAEANFLIRSSNIRFLGSMVRSLPGQVSCETLPDSINLHNVVIKDKSVYKVLNQVLLLCIVQAACDDNFYFKRDDSDIQKYITALEVTDADFYPRSIIARMVIKSPEQFKRFEGKINTDLIKVQPYNTTIQRFIEVKQALLQGGTADTLIDIGCGEMYTSLRLCGNYVQVYALDADTGITNNNSEKLAARLIKNVATTIDNESKVTPEFVDKNRALFEDADVLLGEVVEHLSQSEAFLLITELLSTGFKKIVITTPDAEFNQFYCMEPGQMRHDDHQWEMTHKGFIAFMNQIGSLYNQTHDPKNFNMEFHAIGDKVGRISTTSMVVITQGK